MRMRVLVAAAIVALSVTIAACGSSKSGGLTPSTSTLGSTNPQDQSGGTVSSVTPQGSMLADNGFRPNPNGFGIANYGDNFQPDGSGGTPTNLTPKEMQTLFGTQVCSSGSGDSCVLIPNAKAWMDQENKAMAGGHCFGFSVTALRVYSGNVKVSDLGSASDTFALPVVSDTGLQSTLAADWAGQDLPLEREAQIKGTPNDVLNKLVSALKDKSEYYTIAIFKSDGSGGHAVTPYAVVDKGGGKRGVLIYDNNFPGATRELEWDTNANTWSYVAAQNPSDASELYQGDAQTQSISLFPMKPITMQNPCPFCNGQNNQPNTGSTGSTLGSAQQYNEITLVGNPSNHAHVVLTDDQGHQAGFINGKTVADIPGVKVDANLANQDWAEAPEPTYLVPVKTNVNVSIDGTSLKAPDTEQIDLIGPGDYNEVQDIKLQPGQKDTIDFTGDGTGYAYQTASNQTESPVVAAGVKGKQADYAFAIKAVNTQGGAAIDTQIDQSKEQLDFDTSKSSGTADYVVSVVRQGESGSTSWSTTGLPNDSLSLTAGDKIHIDYGTATTPGQSMTVTINKTDGTSQTVQLPEHHG